MKCCEIGTARGGSIAACRNKIALFLMFIAVGIKIAFAYTEFTYMQ